MAEEILRTYSFPVPGPRNTEKTLRAAIERALQLRIGYVVVAFGQRKDGFPVEVPFRRAGLQRQTGRGHSPHGVFTMKVREIIAMPR